MKKFICLFFAAVLISGITSANPLMAAEAEGLLTPACVTGDSDSDDTCAQTIRSEGGRASDFIGTSREEDYSAEMACRDSRRCTIRDAGNQDAARDCIRSRCCTAGDDTAQATCTQAVLETDPDYR